MIWLLLLSKAQAQQILIRYLCCYESRPYVSYNKTYFCFLQVGINKDMTYE